MSEYHVASLIVHGYPGHIVEIKEDITSIDGAEIHAEGESGKLIVTTEAQSSQAIANITDLIRDVPSVVNVSIVYHEYMPEAEM